MTLRFRVRPPAPAGATATERTVLVDASADITMGRSAGLALELPFPPVSAQHARVVRAGGGWAIVDLGSASGTFVAGRRLPAHEPHPLRPTDELNLGGVSLVFDGEQEQAPDPVETTATLARRVVGDLVGASRPADVPRLVIDGGPDAGGALALERVGHAYRVGRAPHCDLVLADEDVSREHASFERGPDGVHVRDLGSKNGVQRDGRRLEGAVRLGDGDVVVLGGTRLRVDDPQARPARAPPSTPAPAPAPPPGFDAPPPAAAPARRRPAAALAASLVATAALAVAAAGVLWLVLAGSR